MPRATANKSMRTERPIKELRRTSVLEGETDEAKRVPGATGEPSGGHRRPGRAATLPSTSPRARSAARHRPKTSGHSTPRDNPAKSSRGGGKNRRKKV